MTRIRPVPAPLAGNTPARLVPADGSEASPEYAAILEGVEAADAALARRQSSGAIGLFMGMRQSNATTPGLVALRSYAELRRVLLAEGYDVPALSLVAVGFTPAQIARFDLAIATIPPVTGKASPANI